MKFILALLIFLLLGFEVPIEKIKASYGHIQAYYVMNFKSQADCKNCFTSVEMYQEVKSINKKLMSMSYVKASSFVIKNNKDSTYLITSDHVCKEVEVFLKDKKFKILADDLTKTILAKNSKNKVYLDFQKMYEMVPKAYVYSFNGTKHEIKNVVLSDPSIDTCAIETYDSWGTEVVFAKKGCVYEKIFNMSSTGGYYYKNAVSFREGFANGIVEELDMQDKTYKNVNLYTLTVKPGSSGSAVYNKNGEVCGSVNISFVKVDLSAGASYVDLFRFYERLQKKIH